MNTAVTEPALEDVAELRQRLSVLEGQLVTAERQLAEREHLIEQLKVTIARLARQRWAPSSEKHPGQAELSLFNEAEVAALAAALEEEANEASPTAVEESNNTDGKHPVGSTTGQSGMTNSAPPRRRRALPEHLERVRITYELDEHDRHSACGRLMVPMSEEVTEQIGILPARQFVIQHVKIKYACPCKACGVKTAPMPSQPLPGSQASPSLLAYTMVSKYTDALPLYRQQQMWQREGIDLPRAKLARWLIQSASGLQPLFNLMQDVFFAYDIAHSDDTGIQVLKENGRAARSKSALWIRRGGAPETPVILLDYDRSKGSSVATRLLDDFHGYLISDGAQSFNQVVAKNNLVPVLCNDHARRRFVEAVRNVPDKHKPQWVATKAIEFYKKLYRLERHIAPLSAAGKQRQRELIAVPIWTEFMAWRMYRRWGLHTRRPARPSIT